MPGINAQTYYEKSQSFITLVTGTSGQWIQASNSGPALECFTNYATDTPAGRKKSDSLLTGTAADPAAAVTELNTIPQMRSTQAAGDPDCAAGSIVFVAHRIVIQSVMQLPSPTTLPRVGVPPVMLNDIAIVFAWKKIGWLYNNQHDDT